jgi:hypothetical protein
MWFSSTTTKVKYLKILFSQPAKATSLFFHSLRKQLAFFSQPAKAISHFCTAYESNLPFFFAACESNQPPYLPKCIQSRHLTGNTRTLVIIHGLQL